MVQQYAAILVLVIVALAMVFCCRLISSYLRLSRSHANVKDKSYVDGEPTFPFKHYGIAFVALGLQGALALLLIWIAEFRTLLLQGKDPLIEILVFLTIIGSGVVTIWRKAGFSRI